MPIQETREARGKIEFSGVLYHGGVARDFDQYNPPLLELNILYRDTYTTRYAHITPREYFSWDATSYTIGPGFYTTSKREEAIEYATLRAERSGWEDPIRLLYVLTIPTANFFDFRSGEVGRNGRISLEIANRWKDYYLENVNNLMPQILESRTYLERLNSYAQHLKDFINRLETGPKLELESYMKRDLSLRDMLRSLVGDADSIWSPFGGLWVRFVEDELGCDGVILIEGGEGEKFDGAAPTYAIYNLGIVKEQKIEVIN